MGRRIDQRAAARQCLLWRLLCCWMLGLVATAAFAAEPPPAPAVIPTAEILDRADQDQRLVDRVLRRLARPDASAALAQQLEQLARPVEEKWRSYQAADLRGLPVVRLESLDRYWALDARRFQHWQAEARRLQGPLADDAARLTRLRLQWEATRSASGDMPAALADRAASLLNELVAAEQALSPALARQIALGQQARAIDARIQAGRDEVAEAIAAIDLRLLQADAPPLWALSAAREAVLSELNAIGRGLDIEVSFATDYLAASALNLQLTSAAQLLLLPMLLWAARQSRRQNAGQVPPDEDPAHLLRRPISAWLLLAVLITLPLRADAPLMTRELAMLLAMVPALRLLPARSLRTLSPWPQLVIALYALNWLRLLVMDSSFLYRLLQLGLAAIALAALLWLLRAERR
ncbi:mechanosensitive ion channel protein MscS, partial [Paucibacter sp. XJ19-41]|nr:mechanosensitive ion channel protein MscS [Paucibacter sp. XJ19-41]